MLVARVLRATHAEALYRAALFAQGGEFAFVLYSAAATAGIITAGNNATFTAIVILSMALTPFTVLGAANGCCRGPSSRSTASTRPTISPAACC